MVSTPSVPYVLNDRKYAGLWVVLTVGSKLNSTKEPLRSLLAESCPVA